MKIRGINVFSGEAEELTIKDSKIADRIRIPKEADLPYLSPGFFDMQVNGYLGIDYSSSELSIDKIEKIVIELASSGTTQHVPTIITNSHKRISDNLKIIAEAVETNDLVRNAIPAIHIEGPFISEKDGPRGAHDPKYVRNPSIDELDDWLSISNGLVKLITVAPEREGSSEFIEYAVKHGVVISIGHTDASKDDIGMAIAKGSSCSTHLGNGSHAMIPRLNNYIWEQLACEKLYAGIIADGYHLPDSVLKVIDKVKGAEKTILVSDVAFLGGFAPGDYRWGDIEVEVYSDGHIGLKGTPYLAGAGHLLDTCIANFVNVTGEDLANAVRMVSVNPVRLLGLNKKIDLNIGSDADITLFRWDGTKHPLEVHSTYISGKRIYCVN
ncbi:MAG: amidohydrolase family protein [Sphaerochaetaceae bacterium]|nr:amidohydrolase family protein [Sphaerochaetaceae bacterium]